MVDRITKEYWKYEVEGELKLFRVVTGMPVLQLVFQSRQGKVGIFEIKLKTFINGYGQNRYGRMIKKDASLQVISKQEFYELYRLLMSTMKLELPRRQTLPTMDC